jgi:hypothetical protein
MARQRYPTSTVTSSGRLVPWLAAEGPLAYSPEAPPPRDGSFQYRWVLPQVCRPGSRRHLHFGTPLKGDTAVLFAFWNDARRGKVARVAYLEGGTTESGVEAPLAVYRHDDLGRPGYLFIQHGSYQWIPVADQPELEAGSVILHRGIGNAKVFRFAHASRTGADAAHEAIWATYVRVQLEMLSRSDLSFNTIHDRTKRAETGHILDDTWLSDELAVARGLAIERDPWTRALWSSAHQSFALRSWVSTAKFGPSRVVCRTPLANVRITSFFAREHEVRVIDPSRVTFLDAVGCDVRLEDR